MCYSCLLTARYLAQNKKKIDGTRQIMERMISGRSDPLLRAEDVIRELHKEGIETEPGFLDMALLYGPGESYSVDPQTGLLQKAERPLLHTEDDWDWN